MPYTTRGLIPPGLLWLRPRHNRCETQLIDPQLGREPKVLSCDRGCSTHNNQNHCLELSRAYMKTKQLSITHLCTLPKKAERNNNVSSPSHSDFNNAYDLPTTHEWISINTLETNVSFLYWPRSQQFFRNRSHPDTHTL